ncbi:6-phosphofructokinase [bacterium SCSIO 12643]|nr:6-phosphofructokinase [bacterium SCSIO 12643]
MSKIKKIGVLTSGGDAPGMNAAIRAVVRSCVYYKIEVVGIIQGFNGLINNEIQPFDKRSVSNIINKGGTILKTARSEEFKTPEGRKKAYQNIQKNGIEALVVIGGDGSFTGASIFESEFNIPCIGIPGTIDNDIYGTDYTIGFDTAVNTVVEAADKIRDTASSHNRFFFIEVMGRDSGYIAMYSGIACGAEKVLIPELEGEFESLVETLKESHASKKTSNIVIVAEGEQEGGAYEIAEKTKKVFPEYDVKVTVLGHIQRGGAPSYFDRVIATRMGVKAIEVLMLGRSNVMVGIENNHIVTTSLKDAIKQHPSLNPELLNVAQIASI